MTAMRIPYADIAATFASANRTNPEWWRANCPACPVRVGKEDHKQSLALRTTSGGYHCFRCGVSGRLPDGLLHSLGLESAAVRDEEHEAEKVELHEIPPPESFMRLATEPGRSALVLGEARSYLLDKRHLPEERWAVADIGACLRGYAAGRVVVPVKALDGAWFGWVGRAWTPSSPLPYIYPKGMRRGHLLYNHDALLVETDAPVFVVEGVFDALALWPDAVAVLGMPTGQQFAAMKFARRPVVVLLDGDARRIAHSLAMRLRLARLRSGAVILPPQTDPDEVPVDQLKEAAREALSASSARFEISSAT